MQPRASLVTASLVVLALVHAWWGARMLLASNLLLAGSQLVGAAGLLFAGLGARDRPTFAFGLGIAALATAARLPALAPPGPFFAATLALAAAYAAAAWGARRLDAGHARPSDALALRGGLALAGVAYLAFLALNLAGGDRFRLASLELVARASAAFLAAAAVAAPPLRAPGRNGFAAEPSSATR